MHSCLKNQINPVENVNKLQANSRILSVSLKDDLKIFSGIFINYDFMRFLCHFKLNATNLHSNYIIDEIIWIIRKHQGKRPLRDLSIIFVILLSYLILKCPQALIPKTILEQFMKYYPEELARIMPTLKQENIDQKYLDFIIWFYSNSQNLKSPDDHFYLCAIIILNSDNKQHNFLSLLKATKNVKHNYDATTLKMILSKRWISKEGIKFIFKTEQKIVQIDRIYLKHNVLEFMTIPRYIGNNKFNEMNLILNLDNERFQLNLESEADVKDIVFKMSNDYSKEITKTKSDYKKITKIIKIADDFDKVLNILNLPKLRQNENSLAPSSLRKFISRNIFDENNAESI